VTVPRLQAAVRSHFADRAADFGLDPAALEVAYVPSRGGFVNHSFRVGDGRTRYHLKLADTPATRAALRRWRELDEALRPYRAPPVLDWVELGDAGGLLFPVVPGSTPRLTDAVVDAVVECLRGLWRDDGLAARLTRASPGPGGTPPSSPATAARCYRNGYHDRFTEDLAAIRAARPPFVDAGTLELMEREAEALAEAVAAHPSFRVEVAGPVHGDLWLDNLLWEGPSSWHILDWDELGIGDPAADLAMLLGPTPGDLRPLKGLDRVRDRAAPDVVERLPLLGRASLLDWVIDPLADWIEADTAPEIADAVRAQKERVHREALALYEGLYLE
jgi:hypothetical protein